MSSQINFDIIQAHTPYPIGNAGLTLAKNTGKPFIYEIRGFVEDARVAKGEINENGYKYKNIRKAAVKRWDANNLVPIDTNKIRRMHS